MISTKLLTHQKAYFHEECSLIVIRAAELRPVKKERADPPKTILQPTDFGSLLTPSGGHSKCPEHNF